MPAPPPDVPTAALVPFGEANPVLIQIGDIACTATTVLTPSGEAPIDTVFWNVTDQTHEQRYIPTWAVVVGVIGIFFCLIGLLFFLIKEVRMTGWVQVTVQGPTLVHTANLPAGYGAAADAMHRVNYARGLTQFAKNRRALGG